MSRNKELGREYSSPLGYYNYCLGLKSKFEVEPDVLGLKLMTQSIEGKELGCRDIAVSSAKQCYAKGIAIMAPRPEPEDQELADKILKAHHTTRMHVNYTWKLKISRKAAQEFFNEGEHYNTSQQSQRYAEAKQGNYIIPAGLDERQRQLFVEAADSANRAYAELKAMLVPKVEERLRQIRMFDGNSEKIVASRTRKADKLSQEVARYLLPIDQFTTMDYTVNEMQLLRMFRASQLPHVSDEVRYVVARMIQEVSKVDPQILMDLQMPMEVEHEYNGGDDDIKMMKNVFDKKLEGKRSKLIGFDAKTRENVIFAGRMALGSGSVEMSDDEVLMKIMDPSQNIVLGDTFNTGLIDPVTRVLKTANFTFATRLSHTADSQRQRQRATPGVTPSLVSQYDGTVDCEIPMLVEAYPEVDEYYKQKLGEIIVSVNRCIEAGIPRDIAIGLIPNAYRIRLVETGDLQGFAHRWGSRLCYNAQEEIFHVDRDQVEQVMAVFPETRNLIGPPCKIRAQASITPACPEGNQYCGQRVWEIPEVRNYQRIY